MPICGNFVCAFSRVEKGKVYCHCDSSGDYENLPDCTATSNNSCERYKYFSCKICGHEYKCFQQRDNGFGKYEDFVAFDSGFGISKRTFDLLNGTVCIDYLLYGSDYSKKAFFLIQAFNDIKLAKNSLKALIAAYK